MPSPLLALGLSLALELPPADQVKPAPILITNDYTEGVVVDHDGNLYISHGKVVTKITPEGKDSTWAEPGQPNGHKILADGTHLICDAGHRAVLHLDADGKPLEHASKESDGKPLLGPNDLTLDPKGGFYFTDPGESSDKNPIGQVCYVSPEGKTSTVAKGLAYPNGIVLRPGGKELLVGESKQNRILAYPVEAPGKLGPQRVLADLPAKGEGQIDNQPDGIALDKEGNLYVAHYGMRQVQVVSPEGKIVRRYPGGNLTTSNVAFAGPDNSILYATGGEPGGLFKLEFGIPGLVILPAQAK